MCCKLSVIGCTSKKIVGIHMVLPKIVSLSWNSRFNKTIVPLCTKGFVSRWDHQVCHRCVTKSMLFEARYFLEEVVMNLIKGDTTNIPCISPLSGMS